MIINNDKVIFNSDEQLTSGKINLSGNGALIHLGAWKVRAFYQAGKFDICLQEMNGMNLGILGVSEVRWTDSGSIEKKDHVMYFTVGKKHKNGVAIIIKKIHSRTIQGYLAQSDRVIMVKIEGKPFKIIMHRHSTIANLKLKSLKKTSRNVWIM